MYELIRHSVLHKLVPQQVAAGGIAFIIANQFYRFHSFGLELLAFLLTWATFDYITQKAIKLFRKN